jgi:hypothetical protein
MENPKGKTPAEEMEHSESDFEETVRKDKDRPMGEGTRTPGSPPESEFSPEEVAES